MMYRKDNDPELPLSRLQLHALRVVVESAHGSEKLELPREGLEQLIFMAELLRTPGCKRCGIDLARGNGVTMFELHPQGRDERGRQMRFCTKECMAEWDAIENPAQRTIARGYFEGHAEISLEALHGANLIAIDPNEPLEPTQKE